MVADLGRVWRNVACVNADLPDPSSPGAGPRWADALVTQKSKFKEWMCFYSESELSPIAHTPPPLELPSHECPHCNKFFTFSALGTHMFRAHGTKNGVRPLVSGSVCLSCMKDFNTRSKLLHHISFRCKNCKIYYEINIPPMSPPAYAAAEAQTAACRRKLKTSGRSPLYSQLPVSRVPGPLPPRLLPQPPPA